MVNDHTVSGTRLLQVKYHNVYSIIHVCMQCAQTHIDDIYMYMYVHGQYVPYQYQLIPIEMPFGFQLGCETSLGQLLQAGLIHQLLPPQMWELWTQLEAYTSTHKHTNARRSPCRPIGTQYSGVSPRVYAWAQYFSLEGLRTSTYSMKHKIFPAPFFTITHTCTECHSPFLRSLSLPDMIIRSFTHVRFRQAVRAVNYPATRTSFFPCFLPLFGQFND